MSTPTILRVKRLRTQDPSEVIVLSARKRKAPDGGGGDNGEDNFKILKLAATVEDKEDSTRMTEAVNKILAKKTVPKSFEELKERYKKSCSSMKTDPQRASKETRDDQRFRLVSQKRAIKIEDLEEWPEVGEGDAEKELEVEKEGGGAKELFRLFDVVGEDISEKGDEPKAEDAISCNGVEMIREYVGAKVEKDEGYVYDVYYSEGGGEGEAAGGDFDDSLLDGLFSIQPFNSGTDCLYSEYRDGAKASYGEDEDSNDEDAEGNEYPEEDSDEDSSYAGYCDDDGELGGRVKGLGLDSDSDELSSDAEDGLVFTKSFREDAASHGSAYARFKKSIMKELAEDAELDGEEEEEVD